MSAIDLLVKSTVYISERPRPALTQINVSFKVKRSSFRRICSAKSYDFMLQLAVRRINTFSASATRKHRTGV